MHRLALVALARRVLGPCLLLPLATACGDDLPDADAPPSRHDPPLLAAPPQTLAAPLRRLTRNQLHHTVHDLLGDALPPTLDVRELLPPDDEHGGFASNATVPTTTLAAQQLERAAETIADAAVARREHLHPCLGQLDPEPACLHEWIDALAPRAWRRPLSPEDVATLHALVEPTPVPAEVDDDPTDAALRRTLSALLQAPDFLYRIERGEPTEDPAVLRLTDHELAARLSYLVWSSLPDEALWAEAAAGRLRDPLGRGRQLDRMLADPRAARGLLDFHRQWLELDDLPVLDKDRNVFPTFDPALRPLLQREFEAFVEATLLRGDGRLPTLLLHRTTFVPPALALWYGDDAGPTAVPPERLPHQLPADWSPVALEPTRRAGVLTLLPVLATHAKAERSDPVARGTLVRRRLLCDALAAAPPQVPMPPPSDPAPGRSQRDQLEQHAEDPACAACHALIDPVGLAFEPYDAMGAFRFEDLAGNPIDATAWVEDSDLQGTLDGPVALAEALAGSEQVHRCYATQWFRYALGRPETPDDAPTLEVVQARFVEADGHFPTLLRALVRSEAFGHRRVP
ncbi:DUF1592 domain-containing protein [Paraliomyxa miuraensis]|uniref:DUF1592 domain-containing protein n=1 Tax=Paraliomyxa miuraensis TaxID=376150 RepID=UPI002251B42B|nr:DUF1592 domain-containing protein [Paraliomyxa miuraensis]MCX4242299.1 DUF1592 domain-containing protein [Paraliomyxa miuraensis]